jgi:hypothetical protein
MRFGMKELEECGHCQQKNVWVQSEIETDLTPTPETDEISVQTQYILLMCATCWRPTLISIEKAYANVDAEWLQSIPKILYPQTQTSISNLPPKVEQRYKAALKVKYIEPNSFAVMVGKTLEAICNHEQITGKNLAEKIDQLAKQGRIPQTLAEMSHQLRQIRNLGAHDNDDEVTNSDVPIILDFLEAILEYLYIAPIKINLLRERLKK